MATPLLIKAIHLLNTTWLMCTDGAMASVKIMMQPLNGIASQEKGLTDKTFPQKNTGLVNVSKVY